MWTRRNKEERGGKTGKEKYAVIKFWGKNKVPDCFHLDILNSWTFSNKFYGNKHSSFYCTLTEKIPGKEWKQTVDMKIGIHIGRQNTTLNHF